MKITEQQLKQLIKEELKIHEDEPETLPWEEGDEKPDTSHAQKMLKNKVPWALEELKEVVDSYGLNAVLSIGVTGSTNGDFFELTITVKKT